MKILNKTEMLKQREIAFFMEEIEILATIQSEWTTKLLAAFQDETNLYIVMDFMAGGDVASLLMRADEGEITIDEDFTRFYIAESLLALNELHKNDFIHRDFKPGNILLDSNGHVRLADFGSCIHVDSQKGVTSSITVGTPDYISPEVLQSNEGKGSYGKECDFWSLGITMYELLVGDPPFYAESLAETYHQIMSYEKYFSVPDDVKLSEDALDLMKKLICDKSKRMKSVEEIKMHPFFRNVDWNNLRNQTPPFVPKLSGDDDVSNFMEYEEEEASHPRAVTDLGSTKKDFVGEELNFIGFSRNLKSNILEMMNSGDGNDEYAPNIRKTDASIIESKLSQAESECLILKDLLEQEKKKSKELITAHSKIEKELNSVKKFISQTSEEADQKERKLEDVERQNKVNLFNLENSNKKLENLGKEKLELEKKIKLFNEQLESQLEDTTKLREENIELSEARAKVQSELDETINQLKMTQEKSAKMEIDLSQMNKDKAILKLEVENQRKEAEESKKFMEDLEMRLEDLQSRIDGESEENTATAQALQRAESTISALKNELERVKKDFIDEANEKEALEAKLCQVKETKSDSQGEIESLKQQITSLMSSKAIDETLMLKANPDKHDGDKAFMAEEVEKRSKLSNELKSMHREKEAVERDLFAANQTIQDLSERLQSMKAAKNDLQRRSSLRMNARPEDEEMKQKLQNLISELEKEKTYLKCDLDELETKLQDEKDLRVILEQNLDQIEQDRNNDAQKRMNLEKKLCDVQTKYDVLKKKYDDAKSELKKLNSMKEENIDLLEEQDKHIAMVEIEKNEFQAKYEQIIQKNKQLEGDAETLRKRIDDMRDNSIEPEEYSALSDECNRVQRELNDVASKYDRLSLQFRQVVAENEAWKKKHERDAVRLSKTKDVISGSFDDLGDSMDASSTSKRNRVINTNMKALEQKLNKEVANRSTLETELASERQAKKDLEYEIQELRKKLPTTSARRLTVASKYQEPEDQLDSQSSSMRPTSRASVSHEIFNFRKLRPVLFPENPDQPVVQGWLKLRVPKLHSKKFEWIKRYAVLKDGKLFLYEKEKEKDNATIPHFIDLRRDLYQISPLNPSELIHLSNREINQTFTMSVVMKNVESLPSLDKLNQLPNATEDPDVLREKLEYLESSISKEMKFKEATAKMMRISSGDTKKKTTAEFEECSRRIKELVHERKEIEAQMVRPSKTTSLDRHSVRSLPRKSMTPADYEAQYRETKAELAKKEAYYNGAQKMLAVVTDPETRMTLERQLAHAKEYMDKLNESIKMFGSRRQSVISEAPAVVEEFEHKGHVFQARSSTPNTETGCYYCHESFFGTYQTLQCENCRLMCHKFCYDFVDITCEEHAKFKESKKWYFMAGDTEDRTRWIDGIEVIKKGYK